MRIFSTIVCFLFLVLPVLAQPSLENFDWLKSEGTIPPDYKKAMENPTDMSLLALNHFFGRGEVIYGSSVNQYLDKIIDNILKDDPELRNEIRCYVIRSAEVNAFATSAGVICVNLGLIAQASNESEIAFVLAHEIAHYAKKHTLRKKEQRKGKIDDELDAFLKYHTYSREIEVEADRYAIEKYYANSAYSYEALEGVFDLLQYGYLPFDEMPFTRSFVEEEFYSFPDNYYLESVSPIRSRDDYIDTLSTHPNIKKRRENVENIISGFDNNGRNLFVQSESQFKKIREICRFECVNVYLTNHNYDNALFNIYFLQKANPDNKFLDVALASTYYGLCMHKLQSNYSEVMPNAKKIEGEKQQLNHVFNKFSRQELNVLALRNLWKTQAKYPNDVFLKEMLEDVASRLIVRSKMTFNDFSDYAQHVDPASIVVEEVPEDTTSTTSRYQRIRKSTRGKVIPTEKFKTLNYMLVDMKADPDFINYMDKLEKRLEDEQVLKRLDTKEEKTPIKEIAVWSPSYWRDIKVPKNATDKNYEKYLTKMEKDKSKIDKTVAYSLEKLKFDYSYHTADKIARFDTKEYNTYTMMQQWYLEYICADKAEMRLYHCRDSETLISEMGYNNVAFIYVYCTPSSFSRYDKYEKLIFYSVFNYTIIPMTVFNFLLPNYRTSIAVNMVDLRDGKTVLSKGVNRVGDMTKSYINYFIYDSFYNLKKGK